MKNDSLNFIDLFSGCGGFSAGLEMSGHKCLLGVDFDPAAVQSFAHNHPSAHALCMDIHKLTKTRLEKLVDFKRVDMVVGGPPCQGFSTVGKGKAEDSRNSLFKQFVRIVRITNPKIILFENVTGILASKNKDVLQNIFRSFEKLGYQMDARVMSANEHGVPSIRKRTIIMGVKGGEPLFPEAKKRKFKTVEDAFKNLKARNGIIYNHEIDKAQLSKELDRKRLKYIPSGRGIRYERDEKELLPKKLRFSVDWTTMGEKRFRQTRLQRLPLKDPAPTILTSRTMYYHPLEARYLTPREAAACQSFSNSFVFQGSTTAQFRQIGNAVPPVLAKAIGSELKKIKFSKKKVSRILSDKRDSMLKSAFNYKRKAS